MGSATVGESHPDQRSHFALGKPDDGTIAVAEADRADLQSGVGEVYLAL